MISLKNLRSQILMSSLFIYATSMGMQLQYFGDKLNADCAKNVITQARNAYYSLRLVDKKHHKLTEEMQFDYVIKQDQNLFICDSSIPSLYFYTANNKIRILDLVSFYTPRNQRSSCAYIAWRNTRKIPSNSDFIERSPLISSCLSGNIEEVDIILNNLDGHYQQNWTGKQVSGVTNYTHLPLYFDEAFIIVKKLQEYRSNENYSHIYKNMLAFFAKESQASRLPWKDTYAEIILLKTKQQV